MEWIRQANPRISHENFFRRWLADVKRGWLEIHHFLRAKSTISMAIFTGKITMFMENHHF